MLSRRHLLAAAGLFAPGVARADDTTKFPFRVTRNSAWAAVFFGGKEPGLALLIDSGASDFALTNTKAAELGLPPVGTALAQGAIGRLDVRLYQADLLLGGKVRYNDTFVIGLDHQPRHELDGLIPLTRFNVMSFDYEAQEVTVSRSMLGDTEGYFPLDIDRGKGAEGSLDRLGAYSQSVEHQSNRDHRPVVDAEFDGQPVKLLVDTGAQSGLYLFPDYVKSRGLWDHYPKHTPTSIGSLAGVSPGRIVRAERLKIGRIVFASPIVTMADPADSHRDGTQVADGVIGMEFLRRLNLISDPKRRRIWIKPNKAITDGYRIDRTGAVVMTIEGEGRVVDLEPSSPAERGGLRLGDKITGWRGRDGIEGLAWAMTGAPGSKVDIQVERDGKPEMVSVTLVDPI